MRNKIIVIGSANMDMVVKSQHIPKPGETVLGGTFFMNPGGKGANQAVAVSRLGGDVLLVSKIGNDIFGKQSSKIFDEEGVDISGIYADESSPSGIALITVDEKGENSIVVAPGANSYLNENEVKEVMDKNPDCKIILLQLEIPIETVEYSINYAKRHDIKVILNPAPVNLSIIPLLKNIDIITPNIHEAEALSSMAISDIKSAKIAAERIKHLGVKTIIITMGKDGALLYEDNQFHHVEGHVVEAVDTTAAGDVFNGALVVALSEGKSTIEAVKFACRSAAISVTKLGAQSSIPYRNEIILTYFD